MTGDISLSLRREVFCKIHVSISLLTPLIPPILPPLLIVASSPPSLVSSNTRPVITSHPPLAFIFHFPSHFFTPCFYSYSPEMIKTLLLMSSLCPALPLLSLFCPSVYLCSLSASAPVAPLTLLHLLVRSPPPSTLHPPPVPLLPPVLSHFSTSR